MNLDKSQKEELRREIEFEVRNLLDYQKLKLDTALLEELLFDLTFDSEKRTAKIPVWAGDFLQKLDLSEVSFEDVTWSVIRSKVLNFSNTNANIDFNKSYEYKRAGYVNIRDCCFSFTNLSNVDTSKFRTCKNSDFSYTGINFNGNSNIEFIECNLEGIDLSSFSINGISLVLSSILGNTFDSCNLKNTRINISFDFNQLNDILKYNFNVSSSDIPAFRQKFKMMLQDYCNSGVIDNCNYVVIRERKK